jgi:hypothetical protein
MDPLSLGLGLLTNFVQQDMAARKAKRETFRAQQETDRMNAQFKFQSDGIFLQSYPTSGVAQTSFAKYGGWVKKLSKMGRGGSVQVAPKYVAEGEEVVDFSSGSVPTAGRFGNLNRLSSTTAKIEGDSHDDASGGVEMNGGERVFSDRLYVSSTIKSKLRKV